MIRNASSWFLCIHYLELGHVAAGTSCSINEPFASTMVSARSQTHSDTGFVGSNQTLILDILLYFLLLSIGRDLLMANLRLRRYTKFLKTKIRTPEKNGRLPWPGAPYTARSMFGKIPPPTGIRSTGWTVRGSNPGGGEIFRARPDRLWGSPSRL
jgi:hypothetical protein